MKKLSQYKKSPHFKERFTERVKAGASKEFVNDFLDSSGFILTKHQDNHRLSFSNGTYEVIVDPLANELITIISRGSSYTCNKDIVNDFRKEVYELKEEKVKQASKFFLDRNQENIQALNQPEPTVEDMEKAMNNLITGFSQYSATTKTLENMFEGLMEGRENK